MNHHCQQVLTGVALAHPSRANASPCPTDSPFPRPKDIPFPRPKNSPFPRPKDNPQQLLSNRPTNRPTDLPRSLGVSLERPTANTSLGNMGNAATRQILEPLSDSLNAGEGLGRLLEDPEVDELAPMVQQY